MYTIKFTSAYKKSYKRISKRGYDLSLLNDVVDMLRRGVELTAYHHGMTIRMKNGIMQHIFTSKETYKFQFQG